MTTNRITLADISLIWAAFFAVFVLHFGNFRYALIASIFTVVNMSLLVYWFRLPPVPHSQVMSYLNGVKIGAHRGLANDAPENTLAAFTKSVGDGAQMVEFDLEFTSDGVAVLLHDDTVDRTTDSSGVIRNMTYDDVNNMNAAAKFQDWPSKEPIPTLREGIELCLKLNVSMILDVKCSHPKLLSTINSLYQEFPALYEKAAVCSFFPQIVYKVKQADPKIITGHTFRPNFFSHTEAEAINPRFPDSLLQQRAASMLSKLYIWSLHTWMWKVSGINLVLAHQKSISQKYVDDWKEKGVEVVAWTVNDVTQKQFFLDKEIIFLTDSMQDLLEKGYK